MALAVDTCSVALVSGFTTRQVCDLAGVAPSTLNSWARGDDPLVEASLLGSTGKRSDRYWSVRDLVTVRAVKALREAGCPARQLRTAKTRIADVWSTDLSNVCLYWDGSDLVATDQWGNLQSMIRHPGQQLLHLVAVPVDEWKREATRHCQEIDLDAIRARRMRRAGMRRDRESTAGIEAIS